MKNLTRSGTVERENMKGCEVAAVLDDYSDWLRGRA